MPKVKNKKDKSTEWRLEDLKKLPVNALKILNVFVKKNKPFLDSADIKRELGIKDGKELGARLAIFSKYKKEPLISPVLRVGRGNTRWILEKKYIPLIEEVMSELKPYLEENG